MKTKVYYNIDELPENYSDIFDVAAKQSVFLSKFWFDNFIENVVKKDMASYAIIAVEDDVNNEARALMLVLFHTEQKGVFTSKKLSGMGNYYTSLFGPILDYSGDNIEELCENLIAGILQLDLKFDITDLSPLEYNGIVYKALNHAFKKRGWITQEYFCFGNWFLPSEKLSIDDYIANRPSKLRNTLRRKKKKFDKEPDAHLEIITETENIEKAIDAFQCVYEKSWKNPEPYKEFLPGLITACANNKVLRLGIAWIGNKPAAVQLWIVANGTASIFKLAYDPEFNRLSVGSLLTLALMEHVLEKDKVKNVDYLTGDDKYKQDWMSDRRERFGIIAFNSRSVIGLLSAVTNIIGRSIKHFIARFIDH